MSHSNGWVKIHRQILEWEWYDEPNVFRLFFYCLMKANHQDKKYRGETIKRGTFVTSLDKLSEGTGISVQSIRTSLSKLESTQELTSVRTSKGTVIQVIKYDEYQLSTSESTINQQTTNKQLTTTKNDKKGEEVKKVVIPSLEDFIEHGNKKLTALGKSPSNYLYSLTAKYETWVGNGWKDGNDKEIKNWKSKLTNTIPFLHEVKSQGNNEYRMPI